MCTLCSALRPDDLAAASDLHTGAGTGAALPVYSLGQIARQLTEGYWAYTGRDMRAFAVENGDTLTVDFGPLSQAERAIATAALQAWTDVTGITFTAYTGDDPTVIAETTDAATGTATTATLPVNGVFSGEIDSTGDADWIKVTLQKGQTYRILLESAEDADALADPLLALHDATGAVIATSDDRSRGDLNSFLSFTAAETGTYYLSAESATSGSGTYYMGLVTEAAHGADISFDNRDSGAYAYSDVAGTRILYSYVNIARNWDASDLSLNSYWLQTYIHEIGHALGLGHAGNYNTTASFPTDAHYANDSVTNSIMSYFFQGENPNIEADFGFLATVMPADILAIQDLYGSDVTTHAGDTTYGANSNVDGYLGAMFAQIFAEAPADPAVYQGENMVLTLYDTGGHDLLDLSPSRGPQVISLLAETFSSIGGYLSNLTIARGTVIEDVIAGAGADTVLGNAAANMLDGAAGSDWLIGGAGADTLAGGLGNDLLKGGAGRDTASFATATRGVIVDLALTTAQSTGAGQDRLTGVENLTGSAFNDGLGGNGAANVLDGVAGRDLLVGRGGNDWLLGGAGADTLSGGLGRDAFVFAAGADVVLDFTDDEDSLVFSTALFPGGTTTAEELLARAAVVSGDTVFTFAPGIRLILSGFTDIAALADDLLLI
ncbi:Hemolysin-type calcium-binding repeat-containing protein [Gemmobacter aquatilis]|uniref:Hemolysin-type calcium-binding repeat-containing protein n=1 Tax=Gemmobacter aquatilis TaxID=933059 RepID=A0A1H8DUR0_9RHOB|nr:M10 family metallopeptidase C-terminal domain-containing protein [Gemmobacter aquatilis]SEN10886.1 Hemolysin-type calcium-binding repeat-containing protein [Gemmobacter aquatilis]